MHVAIIMDGNGRWAARRGLPRTAGHAAGARAVQRVVEAAARGPVDTLTLYAFSSDNWSRPAGEVRRLMELLEQYLESEAVRCISNGVRVSVVGRRDRLHARLRAAIEDIETATAGGVHLHLRLAIDYSSRDAIVRVAAELPFRVDRRSFAERLAYATHTTPDALDVDLLIRTGGERRLSDFLLWECAYAELVFVDEFWPDFDERCLAMAIEQFQRRERRFGGLEPAAAESAR
jgi:undecaprenyl diphosphate synthase